jgi:hypothetical protein
MGKHQIFDVETLISHVADVLPLISAGRWVTVFLQPQVLFYCAGKPGAQV